jgi:hypothetical protein
MDMLLIGGGSVILVVAVIIIVSVVIGKKRRQEVEELDKMFPDGSMSSDNIKISVEKVRRTTMQRERRQKQQIHRERPKKGQKTLPFEDQEIIHRIDAADEELGEEGNEWNAVEEAAQEKKRSSRTSMDKFKSRSKKQESEWKEEPTVDKEASKEDKDRDKSFAVRKMTRKASRDEKELADDPLNKEQESADAATNRRLYKRSLLKASEDSRETNPPKASLIDTQMYAAEDEEMEEKPTLSRSQAKSGRSWFKK